CTKIRKASWAREQNKEDHFLKADIIYYIKRVMEWDTTLFVSSLNFGGDIYTQMFYAHFTNWRRQIHLEIQTEHIYNIVSRMDKHAAGYLSSICEMQHDMLAGMYSMYRKASTCLVHVQSCLEPLYMLETLTINSYSTHLIVRDLATYIKDRHEVMPTNIVPKGQRPRDRLKIKHIYLNHFILSIF
ncbi:hypothetical protein ACJX0J_018352, partial [Zea mays]